MGIKDLLNMILKGWHLIIYCDLFSTYIRPIIVVIVDKSYGEKKRTTDGQSRR
jgi:hypothetical protein